MSVKKYLALVVVALSVVAAVIVVALSGGSTTTGASGQPPSFGRPPAGDYGLKKGLFSLSPSSIQGEDAVTISNIPLGEPAVGCYVSGNYPNCAAAEARFPHAHIVTIATNAGVAAKCLDTESRDSVPSQVAGWLRWMLARGEYLPCDYANASEMVQVEADLSASRIPRDKYALWVADWDDIPTIPAGFQAKQWLSGCCVDRDTFDLSFFTAPPKPKPAPKPKPEPKPAPKPVNAYDRQYDSGYDRGFDVRWDELHRRKVPEAHGLIFGPGFNPGYLAGWRRA